MFNAPNSLPEHASSFYSMSGVKLKHMTMTYNILSLYIKVLSDLLTDYHLLVLTYLIFDVL